MTHSPAPTPDAERALPGERKTAAAAVSGAPRVVQSDALFAGGTQIAIRHDDSTYILRQTRSGKLILTK